MTEFVVWTLNDWGMGLPGAQRVWWTGKMWLCDRKKAKRFKTREAATKAIRGDWQGRGQFHVEEAASASDRALENELELDRFLYDLEAEWEAGSGSR